MKRHEKLGNLLHTVKLVGGFSSAVRKALRILLSEGVAGISQRLSILEKNRHLHNVNAGKTISSFYQYSSNLRHDVLFSAWHVAMFQKQSAMPALVQYSVTISAVTYNSEIWLERFFISLMDQTFPKNLLNLIIVDNGSTDGTVTYIEKFFSTNHSHFRSVKLIKRPNNGYGDGHNTAVSATKDEYVLITNVDVELDPHSIERLMNIAVLDQPDIAAWEMRQYPYEHPKYYDPLNLMTSWNSHACVLLRRSSFEAVGGFDPKIFMYGEDVELSYALRGVGYHLRYVPHATVLHHVDLTDISARPLQLAGSLSANVLLRFRYSDIESAEKAEVILADYLQIESAPERVRAFETARETVRRNKEHFLASRRPTRDVPFPFDGFDYDVRRPGHDIEIKPIDSKNLPLVTVVTRTHGADTTFLKQSIASVINQTYPNIEHIIVEDRTEFAKDTVYRVKNTYGSNIKYYKSDGMGRSRAGNCGLAAATGEYIVFLDNDDLLYPDHIELLISQLIDNLTAVAAYSLAWEVSTTRLPGGKYKEHSLECPESHRRGFSRDLLERCNFIPIQAILFRKILYENCGGLNEDLDYLEDWNLWFRYALRGDFIFIPKISSMYRTPAEPSERENRQRLLDGVYEKVRKLNLHEKQLFLENDRHRVAD
jgi:GT2 family glycosyltransferase